MSKLTLFRYKTTPKSITPRPMPTDISSPRGPRRLKIEELAKPKERANTDEDSVGPGSYSPKDYFLSTKSKSPSAVMPRSRRFATRRLPPLELSSERYCHRADIKESEKLTIVASPSFSFQRTGHNLKLVDNPSFPGAGRYTPCEDTLDRGFSFYKARREFSWKKCKG